MSITMKYHLVTSFFVFVVIISRATAGEPQFAELIGNVTVTLGREAVLSCVVDNLSQYKVGWLRAEDQTILSLHRRVVTHNPRVGVTTRMSVNSLQQSRTWNLLHIRQIKESDQGCYMCQVNTLVMKKQLGCIQVQVPPNIVDEESDVSVNEGDNVTLTCKATGKPVPRIDWRREDGQSINSQRGENLRLYGVTRQMMSAYLCIASNDVPPIVSKRVVLNVNFAPLVTTTTNKIGHSVTGNIELRLTCQIESHPPSVNHWMKRDTNNLVTTILPGDKYNVQDERRPNYKTNTTLTIYHIQLEDIRSSYICVAVNFMGQTKASIQLHGMDPTDDKEDNSDRIIKKKHWRQHKEQKQFSTEVSTPANQQTFSGADGSVSISPFLTIILIMFVVSL